MAQCVRLKANTDIGLSTTGIAGPSGGTPEKPVGLVWIGYSDRSVTLALKFNFGEHRMRTKERASRPHLSSCEGSFSTSNSDAAMEKVRTFIALPLPPG